MTRNRFWKALFGGVAATTVTAGVKTISDGCTYRLPTLAEIKREGGYVVNGNIFQWNYRVNSEELNWARPASEKFGQVYVWPKRGGACPIANILHHESESDYTEEMLMHDCFRLCVKKMQRWGIEL